MLGWHLGSIFSFHFFQFQYVQSQLIIKENQLVLAYIYLESIFGRLFLFASPSWVNCVLMSRPLVNAV